MHNGVRLTLGAALAAALALTAAPSVGEAQTAAGFRGGLRLADLDAGEDVDATRGFVVGGYLGLGLSDRLALQLELVFGQRGADGVPIGAAGIEPGAAPADLSMQYLDAPVLLRAGFPGERFLPSFFIGPYASFVLGCELSNEEWGTRSCDAEPAGGETGTPPRLSPRSTDFGIVAGAALDMAIDESTIFIDLRYTLGLLGLESGDSAVDARHQGFELTAGFAFPLGR